MTGSTVDPAASGDQTGAIVIECDLPHAPAKVWRSLTEPALLGSWLMPNDIRPAVGHRFTFRPEPATRWTGVVDCEVLAVEPTRLLRYAWRGGDAEKPGDANGGGRRLDSVVTWTLRAIDTGTRLCLRHEGLPLDDMARDAMRAGWTKQVTGCLRGLLGRDPTI